MVVFDTTALLLFVYPLKPPPIDPLTGNDLTRCHDRIEYLVKSLSDRRIKVGLPTPVIAEYLIGAGLNKQAFFAQFQSNSAFLPLPFDEKAAIELALITEPNVRTEDTKAKVRFDRQVVAIAKANGATALYTDDKNQAAFARANGQTVIMIHDIPLPPPETAPLPFPEEPPSDGSDPTFGSWDGVA